MPKYSYSALEKKYNGFASSGFKIDIDGYEVSKSYIISSLEVQLTALYEASYCQFDIVDGFEKTSDGYKLSRELSGKLKIGKAADISLGYGGSMKMVFSGYVDSVEINYTLAEGFSVSVILLDGKGLMMNSLRSDIKTNVKKYSDAVKNTLDLYGSFIGGSKVTASAELDTPIAQVGESDYDFVVRLAKKINYSFYILLGKAYFIPYGSDDTELMKITPEQELKRLSLSASLRKRVSKVVVVSNDESDEKKTIKGESSKVMLLGSGSSGKAAANAAISGSMVKTIVEPTATTPEIAKTYAEAEINRMSYTSVEGVAQLPGLPELVPGEYVEIDDFGGSFDKKYYVRKVIHRVSGGKFTTELELGGNQL